MKNSFLFALKGFLVGMCDLIPGISGGTMAFLIGIYERLISVISGISVDTIAIWDRVRFKKGLKKLDLSFTIPFGIGALIAVLSLANIMSYLREIYPLHTYSFFFGLLVASTWILTSHIHKWTRIGAAFTVLGFGIGVIVTLLTALVLSHSPYILFFAGFFASAAMLLPGISGSYILVILGQYDYITTAIKSFDFVTIGVVGAGILIGLYVMSHVISYLLRKQHQLTIFFLLGIVIGSLRFFIVELGVLFFEMPVLIWFFVGLVLPISVQYISKHKAHPNK